MSKKIITKLYKKKVLADNVIKKNLYTSAIDAEINPEKKTNPYAPDIIMNGKISDLKTQTLPFFKSKEKFCDNSSSVMPDVLVVKIADFFIISTRVKAIVSSYYSTKLKYVSYFYYSSFPISILFFIYNSSS